MQPVDFKALVLSIRGQGGFDFYPDAPILAHKKSPRHLGVLKYPAFPGHFPYGNGNIYSDSQEQIDRHHQSIRHALSLYMPVDLLARHICCFMRGNFRQSNLYITMMMSKRAPMDNAPVIDPVFSFNLTTSDRKSFDGANYFTEAEIRFVNDMTREFRSLLPTMWAFQAAMTDYTEQLYTAIRTSSDLTKKQKSRAMTVAAFLNKRVRLSADFTKELLPAFCLAYHDLDPSHQRPWDAEVFDKGFEFSLRTGMFRSISKTSGEDRLLRCPAMALITTTSSFGAAHDGMPVRMTRGAMLAMIYAHVQQGRQPTPSIKPDI